jgi:hypothetical protein
MAKRKKAKKSYTKRRRRSRMGSIGALDLMAPVAMIGGAVIGRYIANKVLEKNTATAKNLYKAGIQIGAGLGVQLFVKNAMAYNAGSGMIAAGGLTLVQHIAPTLAIGAEGDSEILFISGTEDISTVNGVDQIGADSMNDDINTVNGIDEDEY